MPRTDAPRHAPGGRAIASRIAPGTVYAPLVILVALFLSACEPVSTRARPLASLGPLDFLRAQGTLADRQRARLGNRRSQILSWATRCGPSVSKDWCDVGDATLFDGILCLSGEAESCRAVSEAQGRDGRIWRAPERVGFERPDTFSRDMSLGVLSYLVATRDVALAESWMGWVEANSYRTCVSASDNRCDFTPGFFDLFGEVWRYIGLAPHPRMAADPVSNEFVLPMQARLTPAGYPLHLVAVNILLRRSMGLDSEFTRLASGTLVERQPENPFFLWLHEGNTPRVVDRALRHCPSFPPRVRNQWSFERAQDTGASESSMGWECVALLNLMLADRVTLPPRPGEGIPP